MAVRKKDEFMAALNNLIGDNNSDEALALIEDAQDTFSNFESPDSENWEQRYNDLDASWRKRYKERFFSNTKKDESENETSGNQEQDNETNETEDLEIEDLFEGE